MAEHAKRVRERSCAYISVPGSYILKKKIETKCAGPRVGSSSQMKDKEKEAVLPVSVSVVVPLPLNICTADIDDQEPEEEEEEEKEHPLAEAPVDLVMPKEEAKAVKEMLNVVACDLAREVDPSTKSNDERLAIITVARTTLPDINLNSVLIFVQGSN